LTAAGQDSYFGAVMVESVSFAELPPAATSGIGSAWRRP
jgi:hypothetical protein